MHAGTTFLIRWCDTFHMHTADADADGVAECPTEQVPYRQRNKDRCQCHACMTPA
jgi:hypothetical protein